MTLYLLDLNTGMILPLLKQNVRKNRSWLRNDVLVSSLDWFNVNWDPELEVQIRKATIIIAADGRYLE